MHNSGSHLISDNCNLSCDVLVIGSGAGGSLVASELAKNNIDVILAEEGNYAKQPNAKEYKNFTEKWRNGGITACFGKPPISYAEGRCVGGGTEINSGLVQKCPDNLLDTWQKKYDIKDFSAKSLKPYYDEIFTLLNATKKTKLAKEEEILKQAGKENNWRITQIERAEKNNQKQSMSKTLIPEFIRMGGRLIAKCKITNLTIKDGSVTKASGTAINYDGKKCNISIKTKYIFICCGAIQTPFLLKTNGLDHNIGNSLKIHPTIKAIAQFNDAVTSMPFNPVPQTAITEFMPDIRIGGSVMKPGFVAMNIAEDFERRQNLIPNIDKLGIYYAMIRPESSGKIIALPNINNPIVKYDLSKNDWGKIKLGLDYLMQAMFASDAKKVFPSIYGSTAYSTYKKYQCDIPHYALKHYNLMTIHLFSSCPMGENKALTAVDSYGKLHNIKNLFIADGSIIPEAPGTNPQATIMAITLRNIKHFLYNYKTSI
jgi:hypothetical protein